jgi:hypothetical protein
MDCFVFQQHKQSNITKGAPGCEQAENDAVCQENKG